MKYTAAFFLLLMTSTSAWAGGTVGGEAGGTEEVKVVVPTKLFEDREQEDLAKNCLRSLSPNSESLTKTISAEQIKAEIKNALKMKSSATPGRTIASVDSAQTKPSYDCHMYARMENDPALLYLLAPAPKTSPATNKTAPHSTSGR